ncbi:MAG: hypothetical protein HYX75_11050 [Acidobacteria bacterium]|nr:hypothetical protein [Acidobacteriota bacterium]
MGFNLVDAFIGATIFMFGVLAGAPLVTESARATRRADQLLDATLVAQRTLDSARARIRRGESIQSGVEEESGFRLIRTADNGDPDFIRLCVTVYPVGSSRRLVEIIALVERP